MKIEIYDKQQSEPAQVIETQHIVIDIDGEKFRISRDAQGKMSVHVDGQMIVKPEASNYVFIECGSY